MLDRLELFNFKSYPGHQLIGPFHNFTSIIGPNGSGKSNLMDAISFVVGLRSSTLRSTSLNDLITTIKTSQDATECWVKAVYLDDNDQEWAFKRTISAANPSTSVYSINAKTVSYKQYEAKLESFNILVKARNFLVFQGDVELVAQQSPPELAKLVDQISGSLDLKAAYDDAQTLATSLTEVQLGHYAKRKALKTELNTYREMKKEVELFNASQQEKQEAVINLLVYRLFNFENGIEKAEGERDEAKERLETAKEKAAEGEGGLKEAKKAVRDQEKLVREKEKDIKNQEKKLEDKRPQLETLETRKAHAARKAQKAKGEITTLQRDAKNKGDKVKGFEEGHAAAQKELEKAQKKEEEARKKREEEGGINISDEDRKTYASLKQKAAVLLPAERTKASNLAHTLKTKKDSLGLLETEIEDKVRRKLSALQADAEKYSTRKSSLEEQIKEKEKDVKKAKKTFDAVLAEKQKIQQTEQEANEKLEQCMRKLQEAGADRDQSRREQQFKDTLANLKKSFPGVKGRVVDLCKPTQRKYDTAVMTILGRNIDSIVVDNEKTAIQCVEYLRLQRAGQATFLPLETLNNTPVNDKFRTFSRGARLAIDVVQYDQSVEKAILHACGSALVCDTYEVAREVTYEKGQQVKAVTLDGTVIHKSGNMTGGTTQQGSGGRKFQDADVDALKKTEGELRSQLGDLHRKRPRNDVFQQLQDDVQRLQVDLSGLKDDLTATNLKLKNVQSEITALKKKEKEDKTKVDGLVKVVEDLEAQIAAAHKSIDAAEDGVFAAFCKKIKLKNVREYEELVQATGAAAASEALRKAKTELARVENVLSYEKGELESIEERLEGLETTAAKEAAAVKRIEDEREELEAELNKLGEAIEDVKQELAGLTATLAEKNETFDALKKAGSKAQKAVDKATKEIAGANDEIERLSSERYAIFRRCKLEEIDLPLSEGSIKNVPLEEAIQQQMDIDGDDDGTQRVANINTYGIEVDYDTLSDEVKDGEPKETEEELSALVKKLTADLEKITPNMKAVEKLAESEARFKTIAEDFDAARDEAKEAKDKFEAIKKKRCDLFNKAYNHISERIDGVYKDLTKGAAAPMGGVAYLSLEDADEPYLHGIKYHAMPPMKRFRDMDQLSGGEKTMAALALLFAIHTYQPAPFFVLDEVDSALDNTNVSRIARYIKRLAKQGFQFITISLKASFYENSHSLVGIYRESQPDGGGSASLTLDLQQFADHYASNEPSQNSQSQVQVGA